MDRFKTILTDKQLRICDLLSRGFTNKEIGRTLGISYRTVQDHRANIFKALGVANAVQLVRKVLTEGNRI